MCELNECLSVQFNMLGCADTCMCQLVSECVCLGGYMKLTEIQVCRRTSSIFSLSFGLVFSSPLMRSLAVSE